MHRLIVLAAIVLLAAAPSCGRDEPAATPPSPGTDRPAGSTPASAAGVSCTPPPRSVPPTTHGTTPGTAPPSGLAPPPGPGRLSGTVTDGTCGTPLDGVAVYLYAATTSFVVGVTRTDASGRYRFDSMPTGSYRIAFVDLLATYVGAYYPDGADLGSATPIEVGADAATIDGKLFTPDHLPAPAYHTSSAHSGRRIAVVGDSLVQLSTSSIRDRLDDIGDASVRGISNQRIDQLLPIASKLAATNPTDVVLAVGNNDLRQHTPLHDSMTTLQSMIDVFHGASCIVVLNINSHTLDDGFNALAGPFNRELSTLVSHDPRVHLADWDDVVRLLLAQGQDESTWFTDGLHLTDAGAGAYATLMHDELQRCPRA